MSEAGERLGPYQLLRRLGRGGMGEVWEAEAVERPGERVALKTVKLDPEAPAELRRFLHEARLASLLRHENIVRTLDQGKQGERVYFTMELLRGSTLAALVGERAPAGAVLALARQALRALVHAQRAPGEDGKPLRLIHRDLKPSNLFLTEDGTLKLIDFGLAFGAGGDRTLTRTGTLRGSLPYLSPEQVQGATLDARTDLFSLGLVLHELCTGRRLFTGANDAAVLGAVLWTPIPRLASALPELPRALAEAVDWMLQRERLDRAPSAEAVLERLEAQVAPARFYDSAQLAQWAQGQRGSGGQAASATASLDGPAAPVVAAPGETASLEQLSDDPTRVQPPPRTAAHRRGGALRWVLFCGGLALAAGAGTWAWRSGGLERSRAPVHADPSREAMGPGSPSTSLGVTGGVAAGPDPVPEPPPVHPEPSRGAAAQPPRRRPASREEKRRAPAQGAPGLLTVDSKPVWARVLIDGQELGVTPIVRQQLPSGRHRLIAVREDGQRLVREVSLEPEKEERVLLIW